MCNVKLISITPNAQELIAYCARVSSSNQDNPNIKGLLKYCAKHGHWSVFEMANMLIEVNTTRAIGEQIVRHRSLNTQIFSQRYAEVENDIEIPQLRRQDNKNRQNSISDLDEVLVNELQNEIVEHFKKTKNLYRKLLDNGVAKECARSVLPMNSPTRIYINGNIRSYVHYINARTHESSQYEHRCVANKIKEIFKEQLPVIYDAVFDL